MGRPAIASPAVSDAAVITASSAVGEFPASNLLTEQPFDVWRTSGCAAEYVVLDFGSPSNVRLVWLGYTNATSAATWRVRAADSEADLTADPSYDTGVVTHWPTTDLDIWARTHAYLWLPGPYRCRWWRIDIADGANPDGYYEAGRLYLSDAWVPTRGANFGSSIRVVDRSRKRRNRQANTFVEPHGIYRELDLTLSYMTEEELYRNALRLDLQRAASRDLLVVPDPENTARFMDQAIYGTMRDLNPIQHQKLDLYRRRYRVEEWELP